MDESSVVEKLIAILAGKDVPEPGNCSCLDLSYSLSADSIHLADFVKSVVGFATDSKPELDDPLFARTQPRHGRVET